MLTVVLPGVPTAAPPLALASDKTKDLSPENGLALLSGTANVLGDVSPLAQVSVPLVAVYCTPAAAVPFEVA